MRPMLSQQVLALRAFMAQEAKRISDQRNFDRKECEWMQWMTGNIDEMERLLQLDDDETWYMIWTIYKERRQSEEERLCSQASRLSL